MSSDLAAKRLQFLRELDRNSPGCGAVEFRSRGSGIPGDTDCRADPGCAGAIIGGTVPRGLRQRLPDGAEPARRSPDASFLTAVDAGSAGIIAFAAQHRLLLASGWGPWAREGAILSYGPDLDAITRRSAVHVDKILRGSSPANIPVEQPTRFQLVLNAKTAKALGLTIPDKLLAIADEVIE